MCLAFPDLKSKLVGEHDYAFPIWLSIQASPALMKFVLHQSFLAPAIHDEAQSLSMLSLVKFKQQSFYDGIPVFLKNLMIPAF